MTATAASIRTDAPSCPATVVAAQLEHLLALGGGRSLDVLCYAAVRFDLSAGAQAAFAALEESACAAGLPGAPTSHIDPSSCARWAGAVLTLLAR